MIPISAAAGTGVDWALDRLLDAIGDAATSVGVDDDGEDEVEWSPV